MDQGQVPHDHILGMVADLDRDRSADYFVFLFRDEKERAGASGWHYKYHFGQG
jgi:hypothetical protein